MGDMTATEAATIPSGVSFPGPMVRESHTYFCNLLAGTILSWCLYSTRSPKALRREHEGSLVIHIIINDCCWEGSSSAQDIPGQASRSIQLGSTALQTFYRRWQATADPPRVLRAAAGGREAAAGRAASTRRQRPQTRVRRRSPQSALAALPPGAEPGEPQPTGRSNGRAPPPLLHDRRRAGRGRRAGAELRSSARQRPAPWRPGRKRGWR